MHFTQFNKLQHPFGRNIVLKNMCRGNHIASTFTQNADLFDDVLFQFFISSVGQQILLVDGSPESKFITKIIFHILRQMPRNARLNRVENFEANFADIVEQVGYSTIAVKN